MYRVCGGQKKNERKPEAAAVDKFLNEEECACLGREAKRAAGTWKGEEHGGIVATKRNKSKAKSNGLT